MYRINKSRRRRRPLRHWGRLYRWHVHSAKRARVALIKLCQDGYLLTYHFGRAAKRWSGCQTLGSNLNLGRARCPGPLSLSLSGLQFGLVSRISCTCSCLLSVRVGVPIGAAAGSEAARNNAPVQLDTAVRPLWRAPSFELAQTSSSGSDRNMGTHTLPGCRLARPDDRFEPDPSPPPPPCLECLRERV